MSEDICTSRLKASLCITVCTCAGGAARKQAPWRPGCGVRHQRGSLGFPCLILRREFYPPTGVPVHLWSRRSAQLQNPLVVPPEL